jgi:hypothetical protein
MTIDGSMSALMMVMHLSQIDTIWYSNTAGRSPNPEVWMGKSWKICNLFKGFSLRNASIYR